MKSGLSKEDAKIVSRNFTKAISEQRTFQSKAWTLEHILDEEGVDSAVSDWLTDLLANEYDVFQADYERALERALETLADRRMAQRYVKPHYADSPKLRFNLFQDDMAGSAD